MLDEVHVVQVFRAAHRMALGIDTHGQKTNLLEFSQTMLQLIQCARTFILRATSRHSVWRTISNS